MVSVMLHGMWSIIASRPFGQSQVLVGDPMYLVGAVVCPYKPVRLGTPRKSGNR